MLICCAQRSPKVTLITAFVPSFYYVLTISLSCNIKIPSFIGNLWWDLLQGNHLKETCQTQVRLNQIKTIHLHCQPSLFVSSFSCKLINFHGVSLAWLHRCILISNWIVSWSMIHLLFYPTVFNNHWHFYFCQSKVIRIPETMDETFDALFQFSKELGKVPVSCKVSNVHEKKVCSPLPPCPCLNPFLHVILSKTTPWILLTYPSNVLELK